jgi:hypothetical protein
MSNTGNLNYSLNKNDFYKIILGCSLSFIPFYFFLITSSSIYLYYIRYSQYTFPNKKPPYQINKDISHYIKSLTYNSPFNILTLSEDFKKGTQDKFIGLSKHSYLCIIITYTITILILLEGLLRNFLYSVYVNIIQVNPLNNPFNNPNCINKSNDNQYVSISTNYVAITFLNVIFFFPFIIHILINFIKFDNYDIKHNKWFSYIILFLVFYPFIIIIISKISFYKKLQIFPNLYKFLDKKDFPFVESISNNFNFEFISIGIFLFILIVFSFYTFIYNNFKESNMIVKIIIYVIIFLIIGVFIPVFITFLALSLLFNNNYKTNINNNNFIEQLQNNGVESLYDLLVKYNYPCFFK